MTIGKTSSTISKTELFSKFSEAEVLTTVFPQIIALPCLMSSPLRKDEHPSFSIYMSNNGHVRYIDYAYPTEKGGLLDLLCKYWNCNFPQVMDKLCGLLIAGQDVTIKPKQIKTLTRKEADLLTKVQVTVRPWREYDYEYWGSYGITPKWLKYAEVYPISHKIVTKKETPEDKGKTYIFPAEKYAYAFVERKENQLSLKVYQPYSKKYKWCSKMDGSVISLWTKVPEFGDRIIIASSLKDALCLSANLHIPAIALQGEGYDMSESAITELKRRYKKVFICFDTDAAGKADAQKLAEKTGFTNIVPDLGKEKDVSDYWKSLTNKEDFKQLETLFY